MKTKYSLAWIFLLLGIFSSCSTDPNKPTGTTTSVAEQNPLPSWNTEPAGKILSWINDITDSTSKQFIPLADRIAVFDNDGTLWPEQPVPNQVIFAIDNLKSMAADHPEWTKDSILNGALQNRLEPIKAAGIPGLIKLVLSSHTSMTTEAFAQSVRNWIDTAHHPKFNRLYKELTYTPMVELLNLLRQHQFTTFIVSGGGADFMRVWSEEAYGIPPYQVIGSYGDLAYQYENGKPSIIKTKGDFFANDKEGKPEAIHRFIGKVPVFCGGNSDGDQAMMQYTSGSPYRSFCLILHHTDSVREFAYDTKTLSGHLETALIEAAEQNWLVVDMEKDFLNVFNFK